MTTLESKQKKNLFVACLILAVAMTGCTSPEKSASGEDVASAESGTDAAGEAAAETSGDAATDAGANANTNANTNAASEEELDLEDGNTSTSAKTADASAPVEDDLTADLAEDELSDGTTPATTGNEAAVAAQPEPVVKTEPIAEPVSEPIVAAEPPVAPEATTEAQPEISAAPISTALKLTDLRYSAKQNGGTVIIETSQPATYHTREVPSQNQVVIEIANAELPAKFKRPYVTKDFNQSIASINAYQDKGPSTVRVVVQFKGPAQANVQQSGKSLTVTATGALNPAGEKVAAATGEEAMEGGEDGMDVSSSPTRSHASVEDSRILPSSATDPLAFESLRFYGKPISIEVRDTPVRDVINLIAEQSGANIVLASEVEGNISLKLRQIPWDQALLIVMRTKNLGYSRQGSILRIAPYEALQKETEAARKVADAQRAAEPLRVKLIPVGYAKVEALEKQLEKFLTKDRGRVVADPRTNSLIVTDTPDVLERIGNLVKALDLPPLQVLIEGKVVEARETLVRNFGINWSAAGGNGIGLGGNRFLNTNLSVRGPGQLGSAGANVGIQLGTFDVLGDITATLALMEKEDLVRIVSSPRVVAVNNEQASILQGTNIPIQKVSEGTSGRTITSFEYQPIEMRLEVTPQVTSENDIILQLNIKREFAGDRSSGNAPDINKREAKTKVLVRNGQTAVVGGVYQSDSVESETGVPWLRNIPVLGWLFKHRAYNNEKNELLVFLTPRILNAEKSLQKENTL